MDVPLSERGLMQSLELAPRLAGRKPTLVGCSPLARAHTLAAAIASAAGCPLSVEDDLRELDRGSWAGRAKADIERESQGRIARYAEDPEGHAAPGGERESQLVARVERAFAKLLGELRRAGAGAGTAASPPLLIIVAHAHVVRVLMARAAGWSPAESMRHFVPTLGVVELAVAADGGTTIVAAPTPLDQQQLLGS